MASSGPDLCGVRNILENGGGVTDLPEFRISTQVSGRLATPEGSGQGTLSAKSVFGFPRVPHHWGVRMLSKKSVPTRFEERQHVVAPNLQLQLCTLSRYRMFPTSSEGTRTLVNGEALSETILRTPTLRHTDNLGVMSSSPR